MVEKLLLEFFPKITMELPVAPGGSCCLKPVVTQSKNSRRMYILAQHIQWKFKNQVELMIPSKTDSRIIPVKKYKQFKANIRKKQLGIKNLPALALDGKVLCEEVPPTETELEELVKKILK
jgi:hypothetical protein